jgi:hypothetical protein
MRLRSLPLALVLVLAACGQDAAPTSPREARFTVNPGAGDRLFSLVAITAGNASHEINASLLAPYTFFVENATAPVQGVFLPSSPSSVEDVQMVFGGETVPRVVSDPSQNSPGCPPDPPGALCVNSGAVPVPVPARPEVRFDVSSMPLSLFTANVGSLNQDHLITATQTPATIYLEGPEESASGVFTKIDPNTTLTVTLLIDGIARSTDTSPAGDGNDAIVRFQFD